MTTIRNPAVAGMFYPGEPTVLRDDIGTMLAAANAVAEMPKAMIVPHAGYIYSGPVAATAYATLAKAPDAISTVVLLGPSHRVYLKGLAAPEADLFATPLGTIPIDQQRIDSLLAACPFISRNAAAHAQEHSLEVHLPFLQAQLGEFELIPLVVGDASPDQVEQAIDFLWGDTGTLVVISSDLSHYHDYATARQLDADTADAIESLEAGRLNGNMACGYLPVSGLLRTARRRGIKAQRVDLRNSGDTAGPRDRVVGYGAWVFHEHG